jgi:hypothetical protein
MNKCSDAALRALLGHMGTDVRRSAPGAVDIDFTVMNTVFNESRRRRTLRLNAFHSSLYDLREILWPSQPQNDTLYKPCVGSVFSQISE